MSRRIVALAGALGQFAVADDGTRWYWDGVRWTPWERPALPQPEADGLCRCKDRAEPHLHSGEGTYLPLPVEAPPPLPAQTVAKEFAQDLLEASERNFQNANAVQRRGRPRKGGAR